jgi:2-C-methyl-D-erythritol 4-phosphate cytidylyltransferase/2-C-methyl-D-erythritol 2,4-cyclodiphosphate synthase
MAGCFALVVSAGTGRRFGSAVPKQYIELDGMPVLRHALAPFLAHPAIDGVAVVIHPEGHELFETATEGLSLMAPIEGGAERQDSVRLGLENLVCQAPDKVLIHDAVRPFVDRGMIDRVLGALDTVPAALPAIPVNDTLKCCDNGLVRATIPRAGLWQGQTPQGFRFDDIIAAHRKLAAQTFTDDAAIAEAAGLAVAVVGGSQDNIKITTAGDLERAERHFSTGEIRTGMGVDVHGFDVAGDHVMLCGVAVPFERSLKGHSDADVALHALTDALLGAIAAGDIGAHFPQSDPAWEDAASDIFLQHAGGLVAAKGGRIINLDVTVICEEPKISPYRAAMTARISDILGISADQVSIKGTTTERLGFLGRGEGIAAQAIASIRLRGT